MIKQLFLIRHAKSDWALAEYIADIDRPLNDRGYREARLLGQRLAAEGFEAQAWLCSPAIRAYNTARILLEELQIPIEQLQLCAPLYESNWQALTEVLTKLDNSIQSVALFGHNPFWTELLQHWGKIDNLPTSGFALLELELASWAAFSPQAPGRLVHWWKERQA
jgi:phosphohistidine phosphatase